MTQRRREADARSPFALAVEREREAIAAHEAAARRLDELAAELEQHALHDQDELLRERVIERAARARERAEYARGRAATARQRLRAEGVPVP